MPLPINIHDLINGMSIEWERLEFKAGWNPEPVMHTICAFANDINNWGGGYIIIGISESNGRAVLPPVGIEPDQIDAIQKKLLEICRLISPDYFPVVEPMIYEKRNIIVVWCPGGAVRPYKAPEKLVKNSPNSYYIRRFSSTVKVKSGSVDESDLLQLTQKIPFDDRINQNAEIEDLNLTLIKEYLREVKSDLFNSAEKMPFADLCRQMQIARGPKEYLKPVNVGLLMFNTDPAKFFRGAIIEIVEFQDKIGDKFTEKIFSGPIHHQLRAALQYIKNAVIKERIRKVDTKPEADRIFNYPIAALEEALANAVYHRSYDNQTTIEVSVFKDHIDILSFPGPIPPVSDNDLKKERVVVRSYRNRRIGDFLKELELTEGRSTGIPKIRTAMIDNGSPEPEFHTDDDRTHFLTIFRANMDAYEDEPETSEITESGGSIGGAMPDLNERQKKAIEYVKEHGSITNKNFRLLFDISKRTASRDLADLVKKNILAPSDLPGVGSIYTLNE